MQKKTIAYEYLFNYFGSDTYNGQKVTGASILLAIKPYKDGHQVSIEEDVEYNGHYLSDVYRVSFDRNKGFDVKWMIQMDNLFRLLHKWDKFEYEVVGYSLCVKTEMPEEMKKDLPEAFKNFPYSTTVEVSKEEFHNFLNNNVDEFDIRDNQIAQVPSVAFL